MTKHKMCQICVEEYDERHDICPACEWRKGRIIQLETLIDEQNDLLDVFQREVDDDETE